MMIDNRLYFIAVFILLFIILPVTPGQSKTAPGLEGSPLPGKAQATARFRKMAADWVETLCHNLASSRRSPQFIQTDNGLLKAQYFTVHPETLQCSVERSASKVAQFIGTLSYEETTHVSQAAKNQEQVKNGPFQPESRTRITVFFIYHNGHWLR